MLITSFSDMVKLYLGLAQFCGLYSIFYLFFYQVLSFNKSFETLPL